MEYFTVLTEIGATKIAQATANKTPLKLTKITLGDGNGTVPTPLASQTNLVNEVFSVSLSELKQDENNDSYVVATAIIPIEVGNFWIRELGVFDENDNLIAVGNYPETFKSLLAQGAAKEVVIKVTFQVSSAQGVTLLINPSIVMASQEFVNEKLKDKASIDYVDAKPSGFKNLIINGSLDIWQRGENFNLSSNSYIADRFMGFKDVSYIKVKNENYNSIKMNNSEVSDLNSYDALLYHPLILEEVNLKNGMTYTVSFLYKGDNLNFGCFLRNSVLGSSVVHQVTLKDLDNTSEFKKASFTFTLTGKDITHKVLNLRWGSSHHGEVEIAQIQLEEGSNATNIETLDLSINLIRCLRYFERKSLSISGYAESSVLARGVVSFVRKRKPPSISFNGIFTILVTGTDLPNVEFFFLPGSSSNTYFILQGNVNGLIAGQGLIIKSQTLDDYIELDAEIY